MPLRDLSVPLQPGMAVYPGDPAVSRRAALDLARDGAEVAEWTLGTHAGTHVDAPSHWVSGGRTMSEVAPDELIGPARVIHFQPGAEVLTEATLVGRVPQALPRIVLLAGGHDRQAALGAWPWVDPGFAATLWQRGMRVLGVDTMSPDPAPGPAGTSGEVHALVLGRDGLIVENLRGLEALPADIEVAIVPLPLSGADGAPVRALVL